MNNSESETFTRSRSRTSRLIIQAAGTLIRIFLLTPELAVDLAVIVVGVFVVLAAESGWSEREDRRNWR